MSTELRPGWDEYFLNIAHAVSARADCSRRRVGAVAVDTHRRIIACGYNGAPAGRPGCLTSNACPRAKSNVEPGSSYDTGPGACTAIHAEANALLHGDWAAMQGATIYVTDEPCEGCRKLIRGAGLVRIVFPEYRFGGYHMELL